MTANYAPDVRNPPISYFDPKSQRTMHIDLERDSVTTTGDTSAEDAFLSDLMTPLTAYTRKRLVSELTSAVGDNSLRDQINALAMTWNHTDDRTLKLVRLVLLAQKERQEKELSVVNKLEILEHEKSLWGQDKQRLKDEIKSLTKDVKVLVNERDAALRNRRDDVGKPAAMAQMLNRLNTAQNDRDSLQKALAEAKAENARISEDNALLQRNAERDIELALTEYETAVVGKMGEVASHHKTTTNENIQLKKALAALRDQVSLTGAVAPKETTMNENETQSKEPETLSNGDEVYCKVSGEGPFVLLTEVDEALVEYANPMANKKNAFSVGKIQIGNAWLVRCKDGTFRTLPRYALTREKPKSTLSLGGLKTAVTSDVTAKIFQAIVWIVILSMLYAKNAS